MTVQLREFVTQTAAFHRQKQYEELLDKFSAQLKAQAALHWAHESLVRVPYFKKGTVEDEFLASAALALRPRVVCRTWICTAFATEGRMPPRSTPAMVRAAATESVV